MVFIVCSLLTGLLAYFLLRESYLQKNLIKTDPLNLNGLDFSKINNEHDVINVWMIGDSRISRWDKTFLESPGFDFKNLGVEGFTSSQTLNRLKILINHEIPQKMILEVGINDLKIIGLNKNLSSGIYEQCYQNITSIIDLCLKNDIGITLLSIIPTGKIEFLRRFIWNNEVDSTIALLNNKLGHYCDQKNVSYCNTALLLCDQNNIIKEIYQDGFLHINDSAYKVLSAELTEIIDLHNLRLMK